MFLLFVCLTISYGMRVNLSVAIVAMTNKQSANPEFEVFSYYYLSLNCFVIIIPSGL